MAGEEKIKLILSEEILSEVKGVLLYPKIKKRHRLSPKDIGEFLEKTARISIITPEEAKIDQISEDPSDNKYLSAAVEGRADFIISGDRHLNELRIFQGIRILNPSGFLKLMTR